MRYLTGVSQTPCNSGVLRAFGDNGFLCSYWYMATTGRARGIPPVTGHGNNIRGVGFCTLLHRTTRSGWTMDSYFAEERKTGYVEYRNGGCKRANGHRKSINKETGGPKERKKAGQKNPPAPDPHYPAPRPQEPKSKDPALGSSSIECWRTESLSGLGAGARIGSGSVMAGRTACA